MPSGISHPQKNLCNREASKYYFRHTLLNFSSNEIKTHLPKKGTFIAPDVKEAPRTITETESLMAEVNGGKFKKVLS